MKLSKKLAMLICTSVMQVIAHFTAEYLGFEFPLELQALITGNLVAYLTSQGFVDKEKEKHYEENY